MANTAQLTFRASSTITIPAGVSYVSVTAIYETKPLLNSPVLAFRTPYNVTYTAGSSTSGSLGTGGASPSVSSPVISVLAGATQERYVQLSNGPTHTGAGIAFVGLVGQGTNAITNANRGIAWGNNTSGYLGVGDIANRSAPTFTAPAFQLRQVKANGNAIVLSLTDAGNLYWNGVFAGPLSSVSASSPTLFPNPANIKFAKILNNHSLASFVSDYDGYTYGIGVNTDGVLGTGLNTGTTSSPLLVAGAGLNGYKFIKIATFDDAPSGNTYGLTEDNKLYGWGNNVLGLLGTNSVTPYSSPFLIASNILTCTCFEISNRMFAPSGLECPRGYIDLNNNLYMWGANDVGQLGNGNLTRRSSPTLVVGGYKFAKVLSTPRFTLGLTTTNDLYGWGDNANLTLGGGFFTNVKFSSPVLVSAGLKFKDISAIDTAVTAITVDGVLYSWGTGALGINGPISGNLTASTPTLIVGQYTINFIGQPVNDQSSISTQIIDVIPGQTYDITLSSGTSFFGTVPISFGEIDKIVVSYDI